jgi:hypothetical protein
MAIGSDTRLPALGGSSPLRAPQQQFTSMYARAPMISDSAVQSQVNNQIAAAGGARRQTQLTAGSTKGLSSGRGIDYRADMAQAAADVGARTAAASTEMDAANANASARFAADAANQESAMMNSGLLEQLRNQNNMAGIARRGWSQDLYETMRRGQLGLDSQYLDYTPLLGALLR